MGDMALKETGKKCAVSDRMINYYCAKGHIPGAVSMANVWLIPKDARKPTDQRKNHRLNGNVGENNE